MEGYKVSLYVKGEEQRFLSVVEVKVPLTEFPSTSLVWLPEKISFGLVCTRADALSLIEKLLNASMPEALFDLDMWSILKMQACVLDVEEEGLDWALRDNSSRAYVELYRVKDGHKEAQWKLDLAVSQQEEIKAIHASAQSEG